MAEGSGPSLELQWQTAVNGRMQLSVGVNVLLQMAGKQQMQFVPVRSWLLSVEETNRLDAALHGLVVATNGNGKMPILQ